MAAIAIVSKYSTPEMRALARKGVYEQARGKAFDGFISWRQHRLGS